MANRAEASTRHAAVAFCVLEKECYSGFAGELICRALLQRPTTAIGEDTGSYYSNRRSVCDLPPQWRSFSAKSDIEFTYGHVILNHTDFVSTPFSCRSVPLLATHYYYLTELLRKTAPLL